MSSSAKRRQTIAKRNREQAVKERRAKKQEKKEAKKLAAAEGTSPEAVDDRLPDPIGPYAAMLARLDLPADEAELLTDDEVVLRAEEMGMSRLTAERILALEREREDGARPHG